MVIEEAVRDEIGAAVPRPREPGCSAQRILVVGVLAVVALGVALRLYGLGALPYGLFHDEAWEGLDGLRVLDGAHPLYFPDNNGREPIFVYLLALTLRVFGRNPLGIRAAALVFGVLTLPATYFLGRAWGGRRVGLLSTAILAGMLWHVQLSRVGFRAVALPLFIALGLGCAALALRSRSFRLAVAAGLGLGLCLYTYTAARFVPLALLGMVAYGLIWHRHGMRGRWKLVGVMLAVTCLTMLPLAVYSLQHQDSAFTRSGDVAIWNNMGLHQGSTLFGALAKSLMRTLGMFTWRGDVAWRHNVPHRPVFDPLLALAFLGGLGLAVTRWRSCPAGALSVIWVAAMSLPTLLSEDAPHFLRATGVLPVVVLLPALALDAALRALEERGARAPAIADRSAIARGGSPAGIAAAAAVVGVLGLSTLFTGADYFASRTTPSLPFSGFDFHGAYLREPRCGYAFQAQLTDLTRAASETDTPVYLDKHYWDVFASVRFLLPPSDRLRFFEIERVPPPPSPPFTLLAWPYEGITRVVGMLPENAAITVTPGPWTRGDLEQPLWREYVRWSVAPASDRWNEPGRWVGTFHGELTLRETKTTWEGDTLNLDLRWTRMGSAIQTAAVRIQALGPGDRVVAQASELVGTAYYPPLAWKPGSVVGQRVALVVPAAARSALRLRVSVEDVKSHRPIAVRAATVAVRGNALELELPHGGG